MPTPTPAAAPSLMDVLHAVQMMTPPPAPPAPAPVRDEGAGVTKLIVGGVIAFISLVMMCVFGWVGVSVTNLNTTVTKMSANVDQLQKSIADLQQTQGTAAQQLSDIRTQNARQDARDEAMEADIKRVKDRLRAREGQPPLAGSDAGDL